MFHQRSHDRWKGNGGGGGGGAGAGKLGLGPWAGPWALRIS